jgi:hypothetical protein
MPEYLLEIRVRYLQKFEKEVFQVHFIMGLRQAKAGCRFQGVSTGAV